MSNKLNKVAVAKTGNQPRTPNDIVKTMNRIEELKSDIVRLAGQKPGVTFDVILKWIGKSEG